MSLAFPLGMLALTVGAVVGCSAASATPTVDVPVIVAHAILLDQICDNLLLMCRVIHRAMASTTTENWIEREARAHGWYYETSLT